MRRILIFVLVWTCAFNTEAQTLSGSSLGHYRAGIVLLENASSPADYLSAAEEFETVRSTNPDFAEVYPKLVTIYTKLGESNGQGYFNNASDILEMYKSKYPDKVEDYTYLNAMLKAAKSKYAKGPQRFCGKWRTAYALPYVDLYISYSDGKYNVSAKPLGFGIISDLTINGTVITFTLKRSWTHDPYSEYDRDNDACEGWGRTGTFKVDYGERVCNFKIVLENNTPTQYTSYQIDYYYKDYKTWCCCVQMPQTTLQQM